MQRFLVQDGGSDRVDGSLNWMQPLVVRPVARRGGGVMRRAARTLASGERHEVRGRRGPERPQHGGDSEHARATEHQTVLDSLGGVGNGAIDGPARREWKTVAASNHSKAASTIWELNSVEGARRHSARQEVRGDEGQVSKVAGLAGSGAQREQGGEGRSALRFAFGSKCVDVSKAQINGFRKIADELPGDTIGVDRCGLRQWAQACWDTSYAWNIRKQAWTLQMEVCMFAQAASAGQLHNIESWEKPAYPLKRWRRRLQQWDVRGRNPTSFKQDQVCCSISTKACTRDVHAQCVSWNSASAAGRTLWTRH